MDSMNPDVKRYESLGHAYINYTSLADRYLRKSHQLAPKSAIISAEYGFLIWQYESRMDDGLKLIKTAEQRDPNNPRIHAIRGLVYANSGGNDYSQADAINELQIAIREDPHYAFPHGLLSNIYLQKHDTLNQKREDAAFKALLPK
jgi:Tfp pilus assembly protein PilF